MNGRLMLLLVECDDPPVRVQDGYVVIRPLGYDDDPRHVLGHATHLLRELEQSYPTGNESADRFAERAATRLRELLSSEPPSWWPQREAAPFTLGSDGEVRVSAQRTDDEGGD